MNRKQAHPRSFFTPSHHSRQLDEEKGEYSVPNGKSFFTSSKKSNLEGQSPFHNSVFTKPNPHHQPQPQPQSYSSLKSFDPLGSFNSPPPRKNVGLNLNEQDLMQLQNFANFPTTGQKRQYPPLLKNPQLNSFQVNASMGIYPSEKEELYGRPPCQPKRFQVREIGRDELFVPHCSYFASFKRNPLDREERIEESLRPTEFNLRYDYGHRENFEIQQENLFSNVCMSGNYVPMPVPYLPQDQEWL